MPCMLFDFWEIGCIECELDQHSFEENAADRILTDRPVLYLAHPIGGEAWNRGGLDEKLLPKSDYKLRVAE